MAVEVGRLGLSEAKRLNALEERITKLKVLLAELSLDNKILKDYRDKSGRASETRGSDLRDGRVRHQRTVPD